MSFGQKFQLSVELSNKTFASLSGNATVREVTSLKLSADNYFRDSESNFSISYLSDLALNEEVSY